MKPKATKEYANYLVSNYFQLIEIKHSTHIKGIFEGYELIAKGYATINVVDSNYLNKYQKDELIKIIKEL